MRQQLLVTNRITFTMIFSCLALRSTSRQATAFLVQPMIRRVAGAGTSRYSSTTTVMNGETLSPFDSTPLGSNGTHLLAGLDVYSVPASDGHPLAVFGIDSQIPAKLSDNTKLHPILLLHGRTWSSVPVFHLHLNHKSDRQASEESRSLMEALLAKGMLVLR